MSDTSVQAAPSAPAPPVLAAPDAPPTSPRPRPSPALQALRALASLRLTVVLFVLSLLLVFFGTLAQIDSGLWTAVKDYFRSFIVWVPYQLLVRFGQVFFGVPRTLEVGGSFPFPAGWTLGALLLVNLIAAHVVRLKLTWKRAGIYVLHLGLIVLLLGELWTGLSQVEARMTIGNRETVNYTDVSQRVELAIATPNPDKPGEDLVVTIPQRLLRQTDRISDDQLPFDVVVSELWKNSVLDDPDKQGMEPGSERETIDGASFALYRQRESSGVDTEAREDVPAAKVVFYRKGTDEVLGEHLVSLWYYPNTLRRRFVFPPQTVALDSKTYEVTLRPKREYKDHAVKLLEFRHDLYAGTSTAKNFSSLVELHEDGAARREVKVYMNNPLWLDQETYYQSAYLDSNLGTIFQVVRNPGWFMPYLACILVTLGMMVHFGQTLGNFLQKETKS